MYGRNLQQDALLIETKLMNTISIAEDKKSAILGAGVTTRQLLHELGKHDMVIPAGWSGDVGFVGYTCGGGYGVVNSSYGRATDFITGARIVTPSSGIVDTDDDEELLWAIRGAGLGNFGVISQLRIAVFPERKSLGGFVTFPLAEGAQVLGKFQEMCAQGLPPNFSGELTVAGTPSGPVISFLFFWVSDSEELSQGLDFLETFKSIGTVLACDVEEGKTPSYDFSQKLTSQVTLERFVGKTDAITPPPGCLFWNQVAIPGFSPAVIKVLQQNPPPELRSVVAHHAHGRALEPNKRSAIANRDEHFIIGIGSYAVRDSSASWLKEVADWSDNMREKLQNTGETLEKGYWSFTRPDHCDTESFFGKETKQRLIQLKLKYNPDDTLPQAYPTL